MHCPLPYMSTLNVVTSRFVALLIRRYPLVFGSWCKQLAAETPFFLSIEKSICAIMKRSPNRSFRKRSRSLLKVIRGNATEAFEGLGEGLRALDVAPPEDLTFTSEEAFSFAMGNVYRLGLKRKAFKGISRVGGDNIGSEEHILHDDYLGEEMKRPCEIDNCPSPPDDIFALLSTEEASHTDSESSDFDWTNLDHPSPKAPFRKVEGLLQDLFQLSPTRSSSRDACESPPPLVLSLSHGPDSTTRLPMVSTTPTCIPESAHSFLDFEDTEDLDTAPSTDAAPVLDLSPVSGPSLGRSSRLCSRRSFDQLTWDDDQWNMDLSQPGMPSGGSKNDFMDDLLDDSDGFEESVEEEDLVLGHALGVSLEEGADLGALESGFDMGEESTLECIEMAFDC
ncbi:hypothetical protein DFP72DRAFT_891588 [Ephemerocybe angulata]|uniref:Uncharacterized protein n=1 Tax=Ephemerocybe angulata TaxID=980116 RepID=A0A8H6MA10_9AGAR|nr:hypothetical protein DFP72DRAFT_891588 [Tulosesus angulatus]